MPKSRIEIFAEKVIIYGGKIVKKPLGLTKAHHPFVRHFTAIFPAIAAIALTFKKDIITYSTGLCWDYWTGLFTKSPKQHYTINYWVLLYWGIIGLWIWVYYKFILFERDAGKRKTEENEKSIEANRLHLEEIKNEINSAIHHAPNPNVFKEYVVRLQGIYNAIQSLEEGLKTNPSDVLGLYNLTFKLILQNICMLTSSFSKKSNSSYGSNIMVYLPNNDEYRHIIEYYRSEKKRWLHFKEWEVKYVEGILVGIEELIYSEAGRTVPSVVLPIVRTHIHGKEQRILLSGAPNALFLGQSIVNSTLTDYVCPNDIVAGEAVDFFNGDGKDIRSIFSINIPIYGTSSTTLKGVENERKAGMGVINIDCSQEYLIGRDDTYYVTYSALLLPIVQMTAPHLSQYFARYVENYKGELN